MKNIIKAVTLSFLLTGCSTVTHLQGNKNLHDTTTVRTGMTTNQVHRILGRPGAQIMSVESWNRIFLDDRNVLGGKRAWVYGRTDIFLKKKRLGLIFNANGVMTEKVVRND